MLQPCNARMHFLKRFFLQMQHKKPVFLKNVCMEFIQTNYASLV